MSLEISLLPEFGWSIKNQPVYGPGSVFQGFVKLNAPANVLDPADRLRIVFHASESTYSFGYATPIYKKQLFGSQKILWKRKEAPSDLAPDSNISMPFIIQIPMVQFPPSANIVSGTEGLSYHSNFILSAYLDRDQGKTTLLKTHKTVMYMPFVETSISKKPMTFHLTEGKSTAAVALDQQQPSVDVKLPSMEYVLGDTMHASLSLNAMAPSLVDSISAKLYQVQTWSKTSKRDNPSNSERKLRHLVAQKTVPATTDASSSILVDLDIPVDGLPTFTYGRAFSLTYVLQINAKRKGKIWSYDSHLADIPIKIGTLGYGVRSSQEIKIYAAFKSVFGEDNEQTEEQQEQSSGSGSSLPTLPVPKFLEMIEYEESLPVYDTDDRLPKYEAVINESHQFKHCIM